MRQIASRIDCEMGQSVSQRGLGSWYHELNPLGLRAWHLTLTKYPYDFQNRNR